VNRLQAGANVPQRLHLDLQTPPGWTRQALDTNYTTSRCGRGSDCGGITACSPPGERHELVPYIVDPIPRENYTGGFPARR